MCTFVSILRGSTIVSFSSAIIESLKSLLHSLMALVFFDKSVSSVLSLIKDAFIDYAVAIILRLTVATVLSLTLELIKVASDSVKGLDVSLSKAIVLGLSVAITL